MGSNPFLITICLIEAAGRFDFNFEGKTNLPLASNLHSNSLVKKDITRVSKYKPLRNKFNKSFYIFHHFPPLYTTLIYLCFQLTIIYLSKKNLDC